MYFFFSFATDAAKNINFVYEAGSERSRAPLSEDY